MKKTINLFFKEGITTFLFVILLTGNLNAQTAMINVQARNTTSLNGKWTVILDPTGAGEGKQVWQEKKATKEDRFCGIFV